MSDWQVDIGLEIHVQLNTKTKIFSGASTAFGASPNSQACAVDLGLPGVLPVVNEAVYPKAIRFGLAVDAAISTFTQFDRKNYFYPDLPKGYQVTQLEHPIVGEGSLTVAVGDEQIHVRILRAHLEEDAGKSLHEDFHGMSGIDLNRAGTPLLEIVSEPDMHSSAEAVAYARKIHELVTFLDVSDGDMSKGCLRCDANVSVRPAGQAELGTRTETKNVNSFRFLEKAINFEINRQIRVLEDGGRVTQETRLYDPDADETRPMRSKETATDYRYFPEPDLLPVVIDEAYIARVKADMPELPEQKVVRFQAEHGLSVQDAEVLTSSLALADYFERVAMTAGNSSLANNWIRVELLGRMNRESMEIEDIPVSSDQLGLLISRISDDTISGKIAKSLFDDLWSGDATDVDAYIETMGLKQVSNSDELKPLVESVIADNPKQVEQYRAGKDKLLGFFVGQVMKATSGKANPQQVNDMVRELLGRE